MPRKQPDLKSFTILKGIMLSIDVKKEIALATKAVGPQGQRTRERLRPAAAQFHINLSGDLAGYVVLVLQDSRDAAKITRAIGEHRIPWPAWQDIVENPGFAFVVAFELSNQMLILQFLSAIALDFRLVDEKYNSTTEAPGGVLPMPRQPIVRA